jgi:hypothetical protein
MKDTWNDSGAEPDPNIAGESMWKSPYIWVRNTSDPGLVSQHVHQNPQSGSPNFVYVKLHNGGSATSGNLELYFAEASSGLTWPADWTLIGSTAVASFAAGTTRIVEIPWTPTTGGHVCLLARWVSPTDPMTHAEGSSIGLNVRNNNNIVWRNVNVVNLGGDVLHETVQMRVRNVQRIQQAYSLVFRTPEGERFSLLRDGVVDVVFDGALTRGWRDGGSRSTGTTGTGERLRMSEGATIEDIVLPGGGSGVVTITFRRTVATPRRTYNVDIVQVGRDPQTRDAQVIGGVSYEIRAQISQ